MFARPIRLPLQTGASALRHLVRAALLLVPALLLLAAGVAGTILATAYAGLWFVGFVAVLPPLVLARFGLLSLARARRFRPADLVLSEEGLRQSGGPTRLYLLTVSWAEARKDDWHVRLVTQEHTGPLGIGERERALEEVTDPAVFELGLRGAVARLVIGHDDVFTFAEAEDPQESRSLYDIASTIRALARSGDAPAADAPLEAIGCPSCGAPVAPDAAATVACPHCGAPVEVPAEVAERIRAVRDAKVSGEASLRAIERLLRQPEATTINAVIGLVAGPMLLAWPASLGANAWLALEGRSSGLAVVSLLIAPVALVLGLGCLVRALIVDRDGLQLVTLQMGAARPARAGTGALCRACSAPLPDGGGSIVVRCRYCAAPNVLGLDVRRYAARQVNQERQLAEALARHVGDRRREWGLVALGVVIASVAAGLAVAALRR